MRYDLTKKMVNDQYKFHWTTFLRKASFTDMTLHHWTEIISIIKDN